MKSKAKVKAPGLELVPSEAMQRELLARAVEKSQKNIEYFTGCLVAACSKLAAQSMELRAAERRGRAR